MKRLAVLTALLIYATVVFGQQAAGYIGRGYAAASGGGGPQNYSINRMVFTMDSTLDHFLDAYDTDVAEAHEVLELGTGNDVPEFSWVTIDSSTAPDNSTWVANAGRWDETRYWGTANGWTLTASDVPMIGLDYIDWAAYIPAGSTIIKAEKHFVPDNQWNFSANDTICATLMTNITDTSWYAIKGVSNGTDMAPNMSHANWRYQQAGNATLATWGYQSAPKNVWVPELKTRISFEDWGDVSDWTGFLAITDPPADSHVAVNIKNCVQAAVNGAVNNGIMFHVKNGTGAGTYKYKTPEPRPGLGDFTKVPWYTVTYSTMPYRTPFPGGEFCFVFTTDDGKVAANEAYAGVFAEFGWNYSAFFSKTHFNGAPDEPTAASMVALVDGGNESGNHSRKHLAPYGITQYDLSSGMAGAQWDSMIRDTEPDWMYHLADSLDGDSRETNPYFGKSFATPQNELIQENVFALNQHGYAGVRIGQERKASATGLSDYFKEMRYNAATSDSMRIMGIPGDMLREQNMMGVPYNLSINNIVGEKADTGITEAEVKWNFRRLIRQVVAQKTKVVSLYTHDFKSGGYINGLDEEELRWMLELVQDEGGTCMRLTDFVNWKKSWSTAVATPAAYAQTDSMSFDAADAVWFKPKPLNRLYPYEEE